MSPDFINGAHIIVGFETETTVATAYKFSFNVAIPSEDFNPLLPGYGTMIDAWTKPYIQAGREITDSSGITDLPSITPDDSITIF